MRSQIIQIGNSQGIRIPKILLEEARLSGEVELVVHDEGLLVRRASKPRATWEASFRALGETDDENGRNPMTESSFDKKEWQW